MSAKRGSDPRKAVYHDEASGELSITGLFRRIVSGFTGRRLLARSEHCLVLGLFYSVCDCSRVNMGESVNVMLKS